MRQEHKKRIFLLMVGRKHDGELYVWEKPCAMKGGNRKFNKLGVHHIYQRAQDRGIIFYTTIDRLVYLSVASVKAREYRIRVLAIAIMYSHLHQSCAAETKECLYKYVQDTSSIFARMYNRHYGRHGSLFARPFGSSLKRTAKEIRSNLAYVNNNHSEKGLCRSAVLAQWNLLAYRNKQAASPRPDAARFSAALFKALTVVEELASANKSLTYKKLTKCMRPLSEDERARLADYIVLRYPLVDYTAAEAFYGGFDKMLTAFDSNTGSEYRIREEFSSAPDTAYAEMAAYAEKCGLIGVDKPKLLRLPEEKRLELARTLLQMTNARKFQIRKFLHLPDPDA